ncbi:hypothetical protein SprV_0301084300 [Sparganum proliferum]
MAVIIRGEQLIGFGANGPRTHRDRLCSRRGRAGWRVTAVNLPVSRREGRHLNVGGLDCFPGYAVIAWHTKTTSINRSVVLPAAYQALRMQPNKLRSKREVRPDVNTNTGGRTTNLHVATPQIGPDEGAVINTVASTTTPADGEKRGQRDAI